MPTPYPQIIFSSPPFSSSCKISITISHSLLMVGASIESMLLFSSFISSPSFFHSFSYLSLTHAYLSTSISQCEVLIAALSSSSTLPPIFYLEKEIRGKKFENTNFRVCRFVLCVWIWDLVQFVVWCIFRGFVICSLHEVFFFFFFFV